jgi:hypothetical protein
MRQRCNNPNRTEYCNYGGLGIKVCERWENDFWLFVEDMGERPEGYTLDRIDVHGNYEPSNCRWSDRRTQNLNRRNRRINQLGMTNIWQKPDGKYEVYVNKNRKRYRRSFKTLKEAIKHKKKMLKELYG